MSWSTGWMFVSIFGGLMVALGTWRHNANLTIENKAAIERENKEYREGHAKQVLELLEPEINDNRAIVKRTLLSHQSGNLMIEKFKFTTWQTVAGSELIINLKPNELRDLLNIYQVINEANETYDKILDLQQGIASALTGSDNTKAQYVKNFVNQITTLDSLLNKGK